MESTVKIPSGWYLQLQTQVFRSGSSREDPKKGIALKLLKWHSVPQEETKIAELKRPSAMDDLHKRISEKK